MKNDIRWYERTHCRGCLKDDGKRIFITRQTVTGADRPVGACETGSMGTCYIDHGEREHAGFRGRYQQKDRKLCIAFGLSADISPGNTPVSGGDISRKTESYAELIATYDAELDELASVQAEINKVIKQVPDHTLAMLLRAYYVEGKTWEQTACDIHYSYFRTVHDKHPAALRAVDAILQKSL